MYIKALEHSEFGSFVIGARNGVSIYSIASVSGTPLGIARTSISLVFLISNVIFKIFLKTTGR